MGLCRLRLVGVGVERGVRLVKDCRSEVWGRLCRVGAVVVLGWD